MRPDHPRIFFWSAGISFAATSLYPLMLLINAPNNFKYYLGLDIAWSIYVWLFMPMCAGIVTVLVSDLFRFRVPKPQRPLWSAGLFIFAALVGWGAWQDKNRLPAPQTIAAINGVPVGDFAISVDQCLRDRDTCAGSGLDQAELLAQAERCPPSNARAYTTLFGRTDPARNTKVFAYGCALFTYAHG